MTTVVFHHNEYTAGLPVVADQQVGARIYDMLESVVFYGLLLGGLAIPLTAAVIDLLFVG